MRGGDMGACVGKMYRLGKRKRMAEDGRRGVRGRGEGRVIKEVRRIEGERGKVDGA